MTPRTALWHAVRLVLILLAAVVTATMAPGLRAVPDLVVPVIVAAGLVRGPWAGLLLGLLAGWVVDLVPPGAAVPGTGALVYGAAGLAAGAYNRPGAQWWGLPHVALTSGLAAGVATRLLLGVVAGLPVALLPALAGAVLTLVLGAGTVPLLVRLERRWAPWDRAWLRGPR